MLKTSYDAQSIEGFINNVEYSGTVDKSAAQVSYDTGRSGAWKKWHGSPHASKVDRNKRRSYTSTYAIEADYNKKDER